APARPKAPSAKPASHAPRRPRIVEGQGSLDFLPAEPPQPRKLPTTVEAVIYCEAPVATPLHRAVAAALDWAMVLIGYGLFLLTSCLAGGGFVLKASSLGVFGAALLLIGFTYGLFWTLARTETPGMRWAQLRLTNFDGFPLEPRERVLRFAGSCLCYCTG